MFFFVNDEKEFVYVAISDSRWVKSSLVYHYVYDSVIGGTLAVSDAKFIYFAILFEKVRYALNLTCLV